jgi:hypothetical protein
MLFRVRKDKQSIQATLQLALKHHSEMPATPHQHEHVRQDVIGEAVQPGRERDRHGHLCRLCLCEGLDLVGLNLDLERR